MKLRNRLSELLGIADPPRSVRCRPLEEKRSVAADWQRTTLEIVPTLEDGAVGDALPATVLVPDDPHGAAVLYCHAHGGRYDIGRSELWQGRPAMPDAFGVELAEMGYTVFCVDMPGFGERRHLGSESLLAKRALWQGQTLMGQMLVDLRLALAALSDWPGVDPERVAAFGLSMGATHAYWLAALDERIRAVVHCCAFADIAPLLVTGSHDLHGHYMTIPGLLQHLDMGDVAASIAPRPQFMAYGSADSLTPREAIEPAMRRLRNAYEGTSALDIVVEEGGGHFFSARLRSACADFLHRHMCEN